MADLSKAPKSPDSTPGPTATSPARSKAASPRSKTASPRSPGSPEIEAAPDQVEVDEGVDASASVTDEQLSTYTASLSSSVLDYPTENGRRYHAFRAGVYYGPNDETELDRLDLLSAVVFKTIGKLYYAPVEEEKTHRVLDIGTGTGIWAIEAAEHFPNAEIIGNDLSASQPTWVPPNVKFEIDDVESPWVAKPYDFIFSRTMAGAIKDWPKLVNNIYNNVNPGGWAEFQDWNTRYYSDDGSLTDEHACTKMCDTFAEACSIIGHDPNPGSKIAQWVEEAGFINVYHRQFMIPIGPWAKDPHYKELGMMNLAQILEGLETFMLRLLTGVLGWSNIEVQVLLAQVRNELKKGVFHGYMKFYVVYGQKPDAK
ncbi:Secondary metabolism regulator LAE1 [Colletotrichum aenigma]|uniref:Secondary metabolism regulator LAE1 n=1 Tax=Colletotrichum aenigma TaxID=1215731 RepID=UPI001872C183|nr:Secondary metabolism regulator LAE1 [Colletotrichum aenigma]KAF5525472.1 Secondary metabolism regulator LAE1 [Colletotrichum aenigma]